MRDTMPIDPQFQRIARRLTTFELVAGGDTLQDGDLALIAGEPSSRASERFLGFYSRDGLRRALEAYGVHDALAAQGLGSYEVVIELRGPFEHRVQVLLDGVVDDDHRLIDLVLRPQRVRAPAPTAEEVPGDSYLVLVVEWLSLQNPHGRFTPARPRLPGQRLPGLGLGRTMHNLTQLIAQRLGHDGVVSVPEHYHLAVMYRRMGYLFTDERHQVEVEAVESETRGLRQAAVAWAAERGLIRLVSDDDGEGAAEPWVYRAAEVVMPVSKRLASRLGGGLSFLRRLVRPRSRLQVVLDLPALRQSLLDDPVEGLEPDGLTVDAGG